MPKTFSRYVLVVDNVSSITRSKDIAHEMERFGYVRDVERDAKTRCALVEFERSDDAKYAWRKMDGYYMDGRSWKVDYATKEDFDFFGWKWFEGGASPPRARSKSPPQTPYGNGDDKAGNSKSPSPDRARSRSKSRSPSKGRSPSP